MWGYISRREKTNDFHAENSWLSVPIPSMYGIFTYIWLIFMVNVDKQVHIPYMDPMGYDSAFNDFSDHYLITLKT